MADAVVANRSCQVGATADRLTGSDDQQFGIRAEAHQDITDVSLSELEPRPLRRVGAVEYTMHSSPVGFGDLLPWNT